MAIMADRPRPSQTIRFNAMKTDAAGFENYLKTHDVIFERGLVPGAYRCPAAGNLARLDGFRNGYFSIQGESSMLAALAVEPKPGMNVLDACAARAARAPSSPKPCPTSAASTPGTYTNIAWN